MTKSFGLILAGGEGSRLGGVRKAGLRIGGVPLIERVARVFEGRVAELYIASGQDVASGFVSIPDEAKAPMGPLAGIRAAVRHLERRAEAGDLLITAAVDTPFLPGDYVERLASGANEAGAAFAAWGENIYPTNSAWRFAVLRDALELAAESAGPKAILSQAGAARVDWPVASASDPFANINTIPELIALQRRALSAGI